jgi:DNA invertase Pin-like site-specific DNA recombinase
MDMSKAQQIGYKRVSTVDQSSARQFDGLTLDRTFEDHASGKDTRRLSLRLRCRLSQTATRWQFIPWIGTPSAAPSGR